MGWLRSSPPYRYLVRRLLPAWTGETVPGAPPVRSEGPGEDFDPRVSWQDEMFQFFYRPFGRARALEAYYRTGRETRDLVRSVEAELGGSVGAFLEFACGYGRNVRHLIGDYPAGFTACDLDPAAVEFCARVLGARPLVSAPRPELWSAPRSYERILVASFFTHLPGSTWRPWLARLAGALAPGGVLLFTTHGLDWVGGDAGSTAADEPGAFRFEPVNETMGRLDQEQYGSTYVAHDWVRRELRELGLAERLPLRPKALWGQDLWIAAAS